MEEKSMKETDIWLELLGSTIECEKEALEHEQDWGQEGCEPIPFGSADEMGLHLREVLSRHTDMAWWSGEYFGVENRFGRS